MGQKNSTYVSPFLFIRVKLTLTSVSSWWSGKVKPRKISSDPLYIYIYIYIAIRLLTLRNRLAEQIQTLGEAAYFSLLANILFLSCGKKVAQIGLFNFGRVTRLGEENSLFKNWKTSFRRLSDTFFQYFSSNWKFTVKTDFKNIVIQPSGFFGCFARRILYFTNKSSYQVKKKHSDIVKEIE